MQTISTEKKLAPISHVTKHYIDLKVYETTALKSLKDDFSNLFSLSTLSFLNFKIIVQINVDYRPGVEKFECHQLFAPL